MTTTFTELPPTAADYLAGLYTALLRKGMTVSDIRYELLCRSVRRTFSQVIGDLEAMYRWTGNVTYLHCASRRRPTPAAGGRRSPASFRVTHKQ